MFASPRKMKIKRIFANLPGIFLAFLSSSLKFKAFTQTSFANGWDSYFYLVQLKSLVEEGSLHSKDYSLIYPFLKISNWFCGGYILSLKLFSALVVGGVTLLLYLIAKRWSGSIYLAIFVGSISVFSPHLTYFSAQYSKNLLGFLLFLIFVYSISGKRKWIKGALLLLNFFSHKMTFGLTMIFGFLMLLFKKLTKKVASYLLPGLLLLLGLSYFIPGLPSWIDLARFKDVFTVTPQFAPLSFVVDFGQNGRISQLWLGELIITSMIYFLSIPFLFKTNKKAFCWSLFIVCSLLLFPFFKWSLTGMSYRFFLIYVLLCPLFLSLLIEQKEAFRQRVLILAASVLFMVGSIFSYKSYNPELHDPNYKNYEKLTKAAFEILRDKPSELIIAHNSLAEFFTFASGLDAMPWLPEYDIDQNKLWRIATDVRQSDLENYLDSEEMSLVNRLSVKYFLLPEHLWQQLLKRAEIDENNYLLEKVSSWRNPDQIRPDFLLKKKN